MPDLTILHTNDMHNQFSLECGQKLAREKQERQALLLDAGDAVWAGNVYFRPGGEPVLEEMSRAGYDAMTLGNREFHFTSAGLKSKLSKASFTVLCCNIYGTRGASPPVEPWKVFQVGDARVGVLGATVAMVTPRMKTASVSAFHFHQPVEAAVRGAEELRPECDVLVAMTHIGLRADCELARKSANIDLIIGGHSHDELREPQIVNGVPIVQTGYYAHNFGLLELNKLGEHWRVQYELRELRGRRR